MKKVMFIAVALVAIVCISCTKTGSKDYYSYSTSFRINGQGNNTTELENILRPKLNSVMQLTKEEAQTEWNGFLSSVSNITVTLNDSRGLLIILDFLGFGLSGCRSPVGAILSTRCKGMHLSFI